MIFENGRIVQTSGRYVPPTNTNDELNALAGRYNQNSQNASSGNPLVDFFNSVIKPVGQAGASFFGSMGHTIGGLASGKSADEIKALQDAHVANVYGTDNAKDAYAKNLGAALKTAGTAASFIPGAGAIAGNILGGATQGFGDEFYENGQNANFGTAIGRGLTGAAAEGLTAGVLKSVGNLAGKSGTLGKSAARLTNPNTILGNVGRGAIAGTVGGGTSAVGNTLAAGGSLEDALNNLGSGMGGGALAGGIMGGTLGLGAKTVGKISTNMQNRRFENAISSDVPPSKPVYLGRVSENAVSKANQSFNIIDAERAAMGLRPLDRSGIYIENSKLYMSPESAQDIHMGRIVKDQMAPKDITKVMRNATSSDIVVPNKKYPLNATMGNVNAGGGVDIAHITGRNGNVELKTTYPSTRGVPYEQIMNARDGSNPSSTAMNDGLPARFSALTGNDSIANNAQNVNSRTSTSGRLRQASAQKLLDQYGTVDKPMARSVEALDSVQKIADAGFVKPGDVERISVDLASGGGKVPKLTREIVANAKPVNTDGITAMVDDLIESQGIVDADAKSVKNIINAQMNRINGGRKGSITSLADPNSVFDVMKALEKKSADLKGKSGNNYRLPTPERVDKAFILDAIHDELEDRLYSGANVSATLTPEVRNDLLALAPNNQKWQSYVDNTIMKARDPGELRSSIAPFVRMNRLIENQYMNYGTAGATMSRAQKGMARGLSKIPVVGAIAEEIINSPVSNRLQSKALDMAANIADGGTPTTAISSGVSTPSSRVSAGVPAWLQTLARQNVSRSQGQNATANVAQRQNAAIDGEIANTIADFGAQGGNINNLTMPSQVSEQSANNILEALNGLTTQSYSSAGANGGMASPANPTYTLPNGQVVDLAGTEQAMINALMAGDTNAYGQLSSIYEVLSAAAERGTNDTQVNQEKLTDTQRRANSALSQLNQLEQMSPDFGTFVANTPVIGGLVDLFGGNQYNSQATSLATQLGYMQSGANITPAEAERIGRSYIPSPTDSEELKQQKLRNAREIIENYTRTYT